MGGGYRRTVLLVNHPARYRERYRLDCLGFQSLKGMDMDRNVKRWWDRIRKAGGASCIVGESAKGDLEAARIIARFEDLEAAGYVRIVAEPHEESYWDVYGEPGSEREREETNRLLESWGCWYVYSEYRLSMLRTHVPENEWHHADGVGMCVYRNPTSPLENCYVVDLMMAALEQYDAANDRELAESWGHAD